MNLAFHIAKAAASREHNKDFPSTTLLTQYKENTLMAKIPLLLLRLRLKSLETATIFLNKMQSHATQNK